MGVRNEVMTASEPLVNVGRVTVGVTKPTCMRMHFLDVRK